VIHIALKDHPGVATRSEGDEPRRRIIVSPEE
jgi:predicted RNA-binding protein Jag